MSLKEETVEFVGKVLELLPKATFKVQLVKSEKIIHAYISGNMRKNRIRVLAGDLVKVVMSPYDLSKGRITHRQDSRRPDASFYES